jgi:hypothetical protein
MPIFTSCSAGNWQRVPLVTESSNRSRVKVCVWFQQHPRLCCALIKNVVDITCYVMQVGRRRHSGLSRIAIPFVPKPRQSCQAAYTDSPTFDDDDYEYDSDDYGLLETAAEAPRIVSTESPSAAGPASASYEAATETEPSKQSRVGKNSRRALRTWFDLLVLFGAAVDRWVSRVQSAVLAVLRTTAAAAAVFFWRSPAGRGTRSIQRKISEVQRELPDDAWGKLLWLWDRPPMQRLRLTISMANLSFRLPALLALVATQVGLLASQVSLPMLAPLLLGTGMLLRSIKSNASFLFPRIGLLVVMLWILWFANSVVQNTVAYLRKQGALDNRLAGGIITISECTALLVALVVLLSMLGVNVSALLLPAGIAVAIAAKDLSHNFLAGFFLFVVQPFKLGDRLAVSSSAPGAGPPGVQGGFGWFEGVCEKVDLRYTVVRQGRRRLVIPNSAFLTREFMVMDEGGMPEPPPPPLPTDGGQQQHVQQFMTADHRHVWQYVHGPPVHQELAVAAGTTPNGLPPQPHGPMPPPGAPSMPSERHESSARAMNGANGSDTHSNGEQSRFAVKGSPGAPNNMTTISMRDTNGSPGPVGYPPIYRDNVSAPGQQGNGPYYYNSLTAGPHFGESPGAAVYYSAQPGGLYSHPLAPDAWEQDKGGAR